LKLRLECPKCQFKYNLSGKNYNPYPYETEDKILKIRYGQDAIGKNIDCLICTSCNFITYAFVKTSFSNLIRVSSRYKNEILIEPKYIFDICNEANKMSDISSGNIKSILEDDFHINAEIFNLLSKHNLLTLDVLGLKSRGYYSNNVLRSLMSADMLKADPAGNEVQNIDELDIGEISEKYDIYDRYTEIARNKGQIFSITKKAEIYLADLITQENNKDSALKVEVVNAGTKDATVKLDFCVKSDLTKDYKEFPYEGFSAFIDKSYLKPINYLEDAHLSMKINGTNEKLAITANNIKREDPKIEARKSQEWLESGDI